MIGVIDYDCGNLSSLSHALKRNSIPYKISRDTRSLDDCSHFILPGVGAFGFAMEQIKSRGFDKFLKAKVSSGCNVFGICLGMQLLFDNSEEQGTYVGLGLLTGSVEYLPEEIGNIPNIGWWEVKGDRDSFGLAGDSKDTFYHVHSLHVKPQESCNILNIDHEHADIVVGVRKNNILGVQFHPEKSQKSGDKILRYFAGK